MTEIYIDFIEEMISMTTGKKKLLLGRISIATVMGVLFASNAAFAGVSGNIGVTSNYLWRGVTQTNDQAAVQGGLDYEHASGFSAGTWVSNLADGSYELDIYAGYGGEISGFSYDLGFISYQYPNNNDHFNEVSLGFGYGPAEFNVAYTIGSEDDNSPTFSKGDLYYSLGLSHELANGVGLGATIGQYDFDDPAGDDYSHAQISVSKSDFTFAVDKTMDLVGNDDVAVSVAWSKAFDF